MAVESHVTPEQAVPLQLTIAQQTINYRGCGECFVAIGYPHRPECSLRQAAVNRCPTCDRKYEFFTDGNGREIKMHPVEPCIPREQRRPLKLLPRCVICDELIPVSRPGPYQKTCKAECAATLFERERAKRKAKTERKKQQKNEHLREYWQAKADQLDAFAEERRQKRA